MTPIVLAALALFGTLAVLWATRLGVGLEPDSAFYLSEAQSLLEGRGIAGLTDPTGDARTVGWGPVTVHPPLYPVLLAAGGWLGMDLQAWARWLGAIVFASTIALVGGVLYWRTRRPWIAALGSALVLTSVDLVGVHAMAMSDPTFLLLSVLGLVLLAAHLERPSPWTLLGSAAAVALACLDRDLGIALIATGAVALRRRPIGEALGFLVVSALPAAAWALRNVVTTGHQSDRALAWHPGTPGQLVKAFVTLGYWVIPKYGAVDLLAGFAVAALLIGLVLTALRTASPLSRVLALFVVLYLAAVFFAVGFLDAGPALDGRILAPVYVAAVLLVLFRFSSTASPAAARALMVVGFALAAGHALWTGVRVLQYSQEGQGYVHAEWRQSATIRRITRLPAQMAIYSNAPDAIYVLTGLHTAWVPPRWNPLTAQQNRGYRDQMAAVREQLRSGRAVLVYFPRVTWRKSLPEVAEIYAAFPDIAVEATRDGLIFGSGR